MTTITYTARSLVWFAVTFGATVWCLSLHSAPCFPTWNTSNVCVHAGVLSMLLAWGSFAACFVALGPWSWKWAA